MAGGARTTWLRRCGIALGCLIVVAGVLALYGWWRWRTEPEHWQRWHAMRTSTAAAQLEDMAVSAERHVVNVTASNATSTGATGGDGTRVIELSVDNANAWLARRLDSWLAHQRVRRPRWLREPMITVQDGELVVSFRPGEEENSPPVSVSLALNILDDGQATTEIVGVRAGKLGLPLNMLLKQLGASGHRDWPRLEPYLRGQPFDPAWEGVRVVGATLDEHQIKLIIREVR